VGNGFTPRNSCYDDERNDIRNRPAEARARYSARWSTTTTGAASTLLSRTLGHHIDTPALAQFLGRKPKRRGINIYGSEDVEVDIKRRIRCLIREYNDPLANAVYHRSRARPALDFAVALPEGDDSISIESEDVQTEVPIPRVIVPQQRAGTTEQIPYYRSSVYRGSHVMVIAR